MPRTSTPFVPSPDEITAGCEAIRATLPPAELEIRQTASIAAQVRLLAGILRPMAIAAGYLREPAAQDCAGDTIATPADGLIVST